MSVTIGELAKLAECQVVTVRYYEKSGLLQKPPRSAGGYRLYSQSDVERLQFIRHCRLHGLALEEIKALLKMRETPDRDCSAVNELVDRQIAQVDERIASLEKLRDHLLRLRKKCPHGGVVASCGILKGLTDRKICGCGFDEE
jgi:Cd(II)/Pb(II)-responsive transcriptional regulator